MTDYQSSVCESDKSSYRVRCLNCIISKSQAILQFCRIAQLVNPGCLNWQINLNLGANKTGFNHMIFHFDIHGNTTLR